MFLEISVLPDGIMRGSDTADNIHFKLECCDSFMAPSTAAAPAISMRMVSIGRLVSGSGRLNQR